MQKTLGRLDRSDLRSLLGNEKTDMSGWVVDNLDLMEEELVLFFDRKSVRCEHAVGSMSADVVAETIDGRKVVFENQFGHLDHAHFGKALAYTAGLRADIVVWVVEQERSDYIEIVKQFNCDVRYDAYLVVLEAVTPNCCDQPAGRVRAVAGPPEFMALAGRDERYKKYGSDQSLLSLGALVRRETNKRTHLGFKPRGNTMYYLSAGSGHRGIEYEISIAGEATTVAMWINTNDAARADAIYKHLTRRRSKIEQALGAELRWEKDKTASRGHKVTLDAADHGWLDQQRWSRTAKTTATKTAAFVTVLDSHLQNTSKTKTPNAEHIPQTTHDPNTD